jgi:N-acetylglucosamine-6-phosphate deacetylase
MANNFLIRNVKIHCPDAIISNGQLLVEDGKIKKISSTEIEKAGYPVIDGKGKWLLPGLIDIHINGGGGGMSTDCSTESIEKIIQTHAKFGTTGMLVTMISAEENILIDSAAAIAAVSEEPIHGSKILGIHLEGPFLSEGKRGIHPKEVLRKPDIELFDKINKSAKNKIKILALAPELDGAMELIEYVVKQGIIVGLAHSEATYDITKKAISKGVNLCIHLFNAMSPLSHKEAGPVGAFLTTENTYVEIIPDGVHVVPEVMKVVYKVKNSNNIIIITDAVRPAGTDMKFFEMLGSEVGVSGNTCYLPTTNILAGSALTMNVALRIFMEKTPKCPILDAIKMASLNPARLLKIDGEKGSIEEGKDADLILVDNEFNVKLTIVEGNIVYRS